MMTRPATTPLYTWALAAPSSGVLEIVLARQDTTTTYRKVDKHSAVSARQNNKVLQTVLRENVEICLDPHLISPSVSHSTLLSFFLSSTVSALSSSKLSLLSPLLNIIFTIYTFPSQFSSTLTTLLSVFFYPHKIFFPLPTSLQNSWSSFLHRRPPTGG